MTTREIRSGVTGEFREVAGKPNTFMARVCNYNVPDTYRTSWAPGVFTRSLQAKLPKAVWSHDWNRPIGKVIDYHDSAEGLDVEVQFANLDDVPDARMARSLLSDGIIDNFSFGFVRQADEPDPDNRGVTRITDVDLDEISPVLVGSVPGTRTLAVRSVEHVSLSVAEDLLLRAERGLDITDALLELRGAGTVPAVTAPVTEVRVANGMRATLKRTPHAYAPTNGDGSVCATCGGQADIKAHGARAMSTIEIRDMAMSIASDALDAPATPEDLVAATDAAIDAAIALASYQDLTNLPWWVAQMLALVMAADASIDSCMAALGIPDPDEQDPYRAATSMIESREPDKADNEKRAALQPDIDNLLAHLGENRW